MPGDTGLRNTLIFLAIFILAFFPSAFNYLLSPILAPLALLGLVSPPYQQPILPTCACCPPKACYPETKPIPNQQQITTTTDLKMSWTQKQFTLPSKSRGSYLVTDHVLSELPEIKNYKVGLLNLFVQHTSCALSLNENFDEDVRHDMSNALDRLAPEDKKGTLYRHADEGLDDMPAHIKSALIGASITVPIKDGKLATGTWQGIWYLEFRASRNSRKVVATIQGEKA